MKSILLRAALLGPAITLAGVAGFALPSSMAAAQVNQGEASPGEKTGDAAAAQQPGSVGGVVVEAPRPPSKLREIPPDKKAAFDAEAAKSEAWQRYRQSRPPLSAGTLGQADDYPGLQTLLPKPDDVAPASLPPR